MVCDILRWGLLAFQKKQKAPKGEPGLPCGSCKRNGAPPNVLRIKPSTQWFLFNKKSTAHPCVYVTTLFLVELLHSNVGVLQVFATVKQVQSHPFHARQLQRAPWFHHLYQASQNCSVCRTIWRLFSVWRLCKVRYSSLVASYRYTEYFCAGIALSWLLNPFVLEYS